MILRSLSISLPSFLPSPKIRFQVSRRGIKYRKSRNRIFQLDSLPEYFPWKISEGSVTVTCARALQRREKQGRDDDKVRSTARFDVVGDDFSRARNDIKRLTRYQRRATNLRCNDGKFLISWREARSLKIKGRRRQSVRRTRIVERQTAALTSPYVNSITEKTF